MHIVITRPKEDSFFLIERLKKMGHVVTHLPLIIIKGLKTKKINFQKYKAVIFTSSNAIKFLEVEKFDSQIKCYCVGKATEFAARQAGFLNIYSSEGTVDSLIELIIRSFEKNSGKLLYLSSEFISKNLDTELVNIGYLVDRVSNYTSLPIDEIDNSIFKIDNSIFNEENTKDKDYFLNTNEFTNQNEIKRLNERIKRIKERTIVIV